MMQKEPSYTDAEIEALIAKAHHLDFDKVKLPEVIEDFETPSSFKVRLFIPICIVAFLAAALYLYFQEEKAPLDIVINTSKELQLVQKKHDLMRVADRRLVQIGDTLTELADLRRAHLLEAKERLTVLLENNERTPLTNTAEELYKGLSYYLTVEAEEATLLTSSIEELFKEIEGKRQEDTELFRLLVYEANLQNYLSPELQKSLMTRPKVKLHLRSLHAKMWNL